LHVQQGWPGELESSAAVGFARGDRKEKVMGSETKGPGAEKTDAEWQRELTPEQYKVLRCHGTERAGSSPLDEEHRSGTFFCAACGEPLFSSETKFDSGTGWPSFTAPIEPGAVGTSVDRALFVPRTEVHCERCRGHLGHVFEDGPEPTGLRYCLNGVSLKFKPEE
jgi:peptide-methionine (R)-S-oxide reductase